MLISYECEAQRLQPGLENDCQHADEKNGVLSIDDLRTHVGIGSRMFAFDFHSHLFITESRGCTVLS